MPELTIPTYLEVLTFYTSPVFIGILLLALSISCIGILLCRFPNTGFAICIDMLFEKVANFYGEILGDSATKKTKTYVVTLFFVIFFANILSVIVDFIAPVFGVSNSGDFYLTQVISLPTADMQFNIALAAFSTLLVVYIQFRSLGISKFLYNYFPVFGKGYIEIERGNMKSYIYYPVSCIAKLGDIVISLFLGLLDIIGLFAKIISLGFRLFGNMTSGTVLLGMLIVGTTSFSNSVTGFIGGIDFPIITPLIVYMQSLLVACIQAMVFPLLVAIFIRMAQMEQESSQQVGV